MTQHEHETYPAHGGPIPGHGGRDVRRYRNGLGTAAAIVGLVSFVGAIVPFVNLVAWISGLVGVGLGLAALGRLRRREANNRFASVFGLIVSVIAVALSIATCANVVNAFDKAVSPGVVTPLDPNAPKPEISTEQAAYNIGQGADVEGLQITVAKLDKVKQRYGDPVLCADVEMRNATGDTVHYSSSDFKLQAPGGNIAYSTIFTEKSALPAGAALAPGGSVTGKVCFTDTAAKGEHAVIFEPVVGFDRVEWRVTR